MKAPCLNCTLREIGCHSKRKKYLKYRKVLDYINVKKQEEGLLCPTQIKRRRGR